MTAAQNRRAPNGTESVAIIGGGIAGLATAALLAAHGHDVDLFEQQPTLGGRVGSYSRDGFRFDTGASWYLMPEVFEHFFEMLGTTAQQELDLVPLDPNYRVYFEGDPAPVDVAADAGRNEALFESIETGAGEKLQNYLASAKDTYQVALARFLYNNFSAPTGLLRPDVLLRAPSLARLLTRSLDAHISARFTDLRLQQILGYPAVFLGSSPTRAPSIYHLMSHLDLAGPVLYPQGGFTELIAAIARVATRHGARLHTNAAVTGIGVTDPTGRSRSARVTGLMLRDGERDVLHTADVVVGAADLHHIETQLVPEPLRTHPEKDWDGRSPGPGAVLVMLGVSGQLPELAHHTLFFTREWASNFTAIFGSPSSVPDPASLYVCKPSATDPSVAPAGAENLFVLVPVPADTSIGHGGEDASGDALVEAVADAAIDHVAAWAKVPDLRDRIVVRRTVGPADFDADFNAWRGGALGLEHNLRQSAFFRPANTSSKIDGLLYAGASTVPGIGLPMCLISAELVLKRLTGDRSEGATPVEEASR